MSDEHPDPLLAPPHRTTDLGADGAGFPAARHSTQLDGLLAEQREIDRRINAPELEGRAREVATMTGRGDAQGPYDPDDPEVFHPSELAAPVKRRKRKINPLIEWLIVVAVAITSALLVRAYVVQQFAVEGESMMSTLHDGDRVLVNRLSYRLHDPRRGDVVVLRKFESAAERDLIKRVIGLPGETIEVRQCVVYIDDVPLEEPYLDPVIQANDGCGADQTAYTVPPEQVFVLGDHRGRSSDSRQFGAVPYDLLIGRAFVIIWPIGDWAWL